MCVEACPIGTHLKPGTFECVPCHTHCNRNTGCNGSLPYVNFMSGCLACSRVQLFSNGSQVRCSYLYVMCNDY